VFGTTEAKKMKTLFLPHDAALALQNNGACQGLLFFLEFLRFLTRFLAIQESVDCSVYKQYKTIETEACPTTNA